jgi:uncharacterized protein (TIGR02646 family)
MPTDCLFFPNLKRRKQYCTNREGEYYAGYREYRQEIRQDCRGHCVYCDCHENELSGQTGMHIDHFRPKEKFPELANNPHNLVWSCAGCNRQKSDYWPALGTNDTFVGNKGFIDPFKENRSAYFKVLSDGSIIPLKPPAEYMEKLLVLNNSTPKTKRKLRYQAHKVIPMLEREIAKLEQPNSLSNEQAIILLSALRESKANHQALLDFSLRDE